MLDHQQMMQVATKLAGKSLLEGGIPVGSILVHRNEIVGRGHNRRVQNGSVILHGEMDALENAGRRSADYYRQCTIYTTLSPCSMCSGAILLYGIPRVIVGENRTFMGEEEWLKQRGVELTVLDDDQCRNQMQQYIEQYPEVWNQDIGV